MSPETIYLDCWILNEVDDHFVTIWELVSVLRQRQPALSDGELYQQLAERLQTIVGAGMVLFYRGHHFNGDEVAVEVSLSEAFIAAEAEEWHITATNSPQLKLYITEQGRQHYLTSCKAKHFQ